MSNSLQSSIWVVIPAAGVGSRMGAEIPKQYLEINGEAIIEHSIKPFLAMPAIEGIVVALGENDGFWTDLKLSKSSKIKTVVGGKTRAHSVLNALAYLNDTASVDWVLVHDSVRPLVETEDIVNLIDLVTTKNSGGILAAPMTDTVKSSNCGTQINKSVPRAKLWRALTPQMFKSLELSQALEQALSGGVEITDEASAIEHAGGHPLIVQGRSDNLKVTYEDDFKIAEFFLKAR